MTFKVFNLGSKYPYFNRAYVVRVPIFSFVTVLAMNENYIRVDVRSDHVKFELSNKSIHQ